MFININLMEKTVKNRNMSHMSQFSNSNLRIGKALPLINSGKQNGGYRKFITSNVPF